MAHPACNIEAVSDQTILVIDDEESIRQALRGVLQDEGFTVLLAEDGLSALQMLREQRPALVLLDIWMPGMDGLDALKQILALYPDLPVIMISGHATIATAVSATKLGAREFIEKPLDLNATVSAIKRALGRDFASGQVPDAGNGPGTEFQSLDVLERGQVDQSRINRLVFSSQKLAGRRRVQRTLAGSVVLYGQGLHSGRKSGLVLEPLPSGSGIHFMGVSERGLVPAHLDFVGSTGYATTIRLGKTQAGTIEHLMSALHAYGITNLLIKCNGEVPVMDGSAREFCALIDDTGIEEQPGDWYEIAIKKTLRVGRENEFIQIEPADEFIVDYTLDYPPPLGRQQMVFCLDDPARYRSQIAPARTFGLVRDIGVLQRQGLALGGRFDNFVLIGPDGPVNTELRFPDEMVRHKILDLIGDLYLLGRPIRGKVTACMTGHSDNVSLLRLIKAQMGE